MNVKQLARWYALALGAGLLLEGAALLLEAGFFSATVDVPHNALHVLWGSAILLLVAKQKSSAPAVLLAFGAFYVALGALGILTTNPFGLLLGAGENAFHLTVGPLALVLGLLGFSEQRRAAHARQV